MSFSFYQTATKTSPEVKVDGATGTVELRGNSSPENVLRFYEPVFQAIDDLRKTTSQNILATFEMNYFNTGSSKCFYVILSKLKDLEASGRNITVIWQYEEDDDGMFEIGEDYRDMLGLSFEFKEACFH